MKKLLLFVFVSLLLCAAMPGDLVCQNQPLTVKEIVHKCAEAMGGIDKIDAWKTLRCSQIFPDHKGLIRYEIKRPNLVRLGDNLVFDGKRAAWLERKTADGKIKKAALVLQDEWKDFELDIAWYVPAFFDYPSEYMGRETVNGIETHKLRVKLPLGAVMEYNLDATTYLVLKVTAHVTIGGKEHHPEREYKDYREHDGILYPHAFTYQGRDGGVLTATMKTLEFNVSLGIDRFALPLVIK